MKIEELQQSTIQRQIKNGYKEEFVKQAWIKAKNYGEFEIILFKSSQESFKEPSNYFEQNDRQYENKFSVIIKTDFTPNQIDEEDKLLQKAIEASKIYQENQKYAVEQGIRKQGQPVGLLNLGATCYFNSLIQTYLFNEKFFKTLLSWEPPQDRSKFSSNICQAILFVESLQQLFVKMYCSDNVYVDPEEVISFMSNYEGLQLNFYEQQDLAEFNHLMLQKIENAILYLKIHIQEEQKKLQNESDDNNPFSIIKNTYFGKLDCKIVVDKKVQEQYYEDFNFIQIDVTSGNLVEGLQNFLNQKIENYKNQTQQVIEVYKNCSFSQLPEIISFQIQRVKFSTMLQSTTKDSRNFFFETELDLQQFCSEEFFDEPQQGTQDDDFNFQSILNHLEGAHKFFSIQGSDQSKLKKFQLNSNSNVQSVQEILSDSIEQIKIKIQLQEQQQIKKQLLKNQEQICTKYFLQSIIIHQGTSQHGHYFSFIKDFYLNKWFKFNDFKVEEVSEEVVLQMALGIEKVHESSSYLIMYLNERQVQKEKQSTIPIRLFNTSKNKDFLNDVYGQFIKEKQQKNLDMILKGNQTIQFEQNAQKMIQDFSLQKIVCQYQKNYDTLIDLYKQFSENCSKKQALQMVPPFYNFGLYYYCCGNHPSNIKWLCIDLAIKQQFSKEYGIFSGKLINLTIQQQLIQSIQQIVNEVYQKSFNSNKYLIKYLPEISHYQILIKNYLNTLKSCYIGNEVLKLYYAKQDFQCLGALQALVKFAKSISVENFGFELAVKLRFFIPNFILVPMLKEYETEFNEDVFLLVMAFDKQGFFEYQNQLHSEFLCQTALTFFNDHIGKLKGLPKLVDKSNQDTLQFLENEKEAFNDRIKNSIDQLFEKYDPKDIQFDKIDVTFYCEFTKQLKKILKQ